jgi:Ssp1 endopeptidase immunity protein Rap1a
MHKAATTAAVVLCSALMLTALTTKAEQIYLPHYMDGNGLLDACKSGGGENSALCLGYILGVADTLAEWKYSQGGDVCLNPQVPGGEITDTVVRFLQEHPDSRHAGASLQTMAAVALALHCSLPNELQRRSR